MKLTIEARPCFSYHNNFHIQLDNYIMQLEGQNYTYKVGMTDCLYPHLYHHAAWYSLANLWFIQVNTFKDTFSVQRSTIRHVGDEANIVCT